MKHIDDEDEEKLFAAIGGTAQKAASAFALGTLVWHKGNAAYKWWQGRHQWEVCITEGNDIYDPVQEWLLEQLQRQNIRSVEALVRRSQNRSVSDSPRKKKVVAAFDGTLSQWMTIGEHKVKITSYKDESNSIEVNYGGGAMSMRRQVIRFACRSETARDAVLRELDNVVSAAEAGTDGRRCFVLGRWGDWMRRDHLYGRSLDTVFMPGSGIADIVADLELFLRSEQEYVKLGLPWHRGYLLHGVPGTGKTSLAKALACHLNLDLYTMHLHDIDSDSDLTNALCGVEGPAVLLIEDVDVVSAATSREEKEKSVSTAGLLNALDGVGTPHGLVTILTTNYPETLDTALIRSGRIDYKLECLPLSACEAAAMIRSVTGHDPDFVLRDDIVPADIMELVKRNLSDKDEILQAIEDEMSKRIC